MTRFFLYLMLKSDEKQIFVLTSIGANLIQPDFSQTGSFSESINAKYGSRGVMVFCTLGPHDLLLDADEEGVA